MLIVVLQISGEVLPNFFASRLEDEAMKEFDSIPESSELYVGPVVSHMSLQVVGHLE